MKQIDELLSMREWTPAEIRELRRSRRETQAAFGFALGITQVTVARLEAGRNRPSLPTLRALDELERAGENGR